MPRNGSGHVAQNAVENGSNLAHGVGEVKDSHVARADKTAPMPEHEKGAGIEGMNASGGQSQGLAQGPNAGQGGSGSKN